MDVYEQSRQQMELDRQIHKKYQEIIAISVQRSKLEQQRMILLARETRAREVLQENKRELSVIEHQTERLNKISSYSRWLTQ